MNKQFVLYELALKLKERGFNEECLAVWDNQTKELFMNDTREVNINQIPSIFTLAPLWQQAFDWFREKHNLHLEITLIRDDVYSYEIYNYNDDKWVGYKEVGYHTAKQKGLEKLIEIIKRIA